MRGIRNVKKKNLIFGIFFIVVFFVVIMHAYNSYSATKEYFLGDTNLDNKINLSDELVLLRHIYAVKSGKNTKWRLTGGALVNADINEDKTVNISDVLNIKRYLIAQKDKSIAEKHADWNNLCKKIVKEESDIIKTYTLTVKPENKQYIGENQNTITITAPELSYNVSFEGNGGSTPYTQKSIRGFENWTLSGSGKIGNKNLATTTYTFEKGDAVLTANYKKEGKLIVLPNSQKDKYRIEGWYDSKELNNKIGNAGDTYSPTQDIKLYAKWVEQGEEPIRNIELNKSSVIMDLSSNKTEQLVAKISQTDNNDNTNFTWTSSNTNVATVSNDGLVTGEANGETVIIVKDDSGAVATCKVTVQTSPIGITLNITEQKLDISSNNKFTLVPTLIPATSSVNRTIQVKSSDPKVAIISTEGVVTAKSNGTTVITFCTANGKEASCKVTVQTSPTSISLDKTQLNIDTSISKTQKLVATINPTTTNINKGLSWQSSNPNIATVSNDGTVTGIATGNTTIRVTTQNGKSATCNVDVKIQQTEPVKVTLNKTALNIDLSGSKTDKLIATTNSSESINWSSSNTNIATVSNEGLVTGKANGTATITAKISSGGEATCKVTVQTSPTGISLNVTKKTLDLSGTKTFNITTIIIPSTANINNNIFMSSSNPSVVQVTNKGEVTGVSNGTAKIIVKTSNGKEASCDITVGTSPTGVSLNVTKKTLDLSGTKTFSITATVVPSTANMNKTLSVKSDNENVATISGSGVVTGKSNGTANITVQTQNGKLATCNVAVQTSPTNIYFKENKTDKTKYLSVKKGASKATNIVIEPSTANVETKITYSIISGNNKVASINSTTGRILGKQAGVVKIKAKTANGKIAYIYLNVKIGNKAFDTTKLSNQNYTKSSLLYSRSVDIGAGFSPQISSHMQSFDIDSKGNIYYGSNGSGTRKDSFITYASKNKVSNNYMKITYFGHQAAIDMEESGTERYIWVEALSHARGYNGYTGNFIISRMKYIKGASYKYAMGTVKEKNSSGKLLKTYKNPNGQNYIYINAKGNMIRGMHASVDEKNRLLAIFYGKQIFIYDLDEAIAIANADYKQEVDTDDGKRIVEFQAKNLNSIKKLTTITIQSDRKNIDKDILSYAMQGFDLDGDYVYLAEGFAYSGEDGTTQKKSRAYVTVFNYMYNNNGYKPAKARMEVVAYNDTKSKAFLTSIGDTNMAEIEGIKVNSSGTNPIMYLGLMTKYNSTSKRSTNILKYTY